MATNNDIVFDPKKSLKAQKLLSLSSKELFERYFIKDNKVSWLTDFNNELNKSQENNSNLDLYPYLVSLIGGALNFIPSFIHKKINKYVPLGYKLNASAIANDIEQLLEENVNETRAASVNDRANRFIVEVMEFSVGLYNKGLDYKLGLTQ